MDKGSPLSLVSEMNDSLRLCLTPFFDQEVETHNLYLLMWSGWLGKSIQGYVLLQSAGMEDASRMILRTAIEMMFKIHAVSNDRTLILNAMRFEFEEDKKWLKGIAKTSAEQAEIEADYDLKWRDVLTAYKNKIDTEIPSNIGALCPALAASKSGLGKYYEAAYRLYCRYTHGHSAAINGSLKDIKVDDDRIACFMQLVAIEALVPIGATCDKLVQYRKVLGIKDQ